MIHCRQILFDSSYFRKIFCFIRIRSAYYKSLNITVNHIASHYTVIKVVGLIDLLALGPGPSMGVKSLCVHKSGLKVLVALSGNHYIFFYTIVLYCLNLVLYCTISMLYFTLITIINSNFFCSLYRNLCRSILLIEYNYYFYCYLV
jgi:hypothetical protein